MEKYGLFHYRDQAGVVDVDLLKDDGITFSVLVSILQGTCAEVYTDHENVIICHSCEPYPVWVWCKNVENGADIAKIAACLKEAFPLEGGYKYNLGYELLEQLKRVDSYFEDSTIKMNLLSYRLDQINEIHYPCGGELVPAKAEDRDRLITLWHDLVLEMEGMELDGEQCRDRVDRHLEAGTLFSWRNEAGEIMALTSRGDTGSYSKIAAVYTLPEHRRKGYAINLVHQVTEMILADGLTPILYTNADYGASNACYRKIGYQEVGRLCTVCVK